MKISSPVLGAGSPILDLLAQVDDAFISKIDGDKGGMVLVSSGQLETILNEVPGKVKKAAGGSAGNTIFGLSRLGVKTSFLGKLGQDDDGRLYSGELAELGGDTSNFLYDDKTHTARCLSLITPDSERTMRTDLGAAAGLSAADISEANFKNVSHVHIEGYLLFVGETAMQVLRCAKAAGCTISLDLASFEVVRACKNALPEILKEYVDIVFANEDEANEFCGAIPVEEQAAKLNELCKVAVVKLGSKGCCIKENDLLVKVQAEVVDAVDTTGAGDLWQAGFLYGMLQGKSLEECGRCGAVLGAEVVKIIGASIPETAWQDIRKRI